MNKLRSALGLMIVALVPMFARAGVPSAVNFQGRLTDAAGNSLTSSQSIVFSVWDSASAGTQLWTETQTVSVSSGIYNVALGSVVPLSTGVFSSGSIWLQIKVGADAAMTPRLKLQSVAYAFVAESANTAAGLAASSGYSVAVSTNLTIGTGSVISTFTASGNLSLPGTVTAGNFVGNGAGLTNLPVSTASGTASMAFPDGLAGLTPVVQKISLSSPYTVPSGKNFYLTNVATGTVACGQYSLCDLTVGGSGNALHGGWFWSGYSTLIYAPTTVLASTSAAITFDIWGFTVPATVTVVLVNIAPAGTYTVPSGQNLFITSVASPRSAGNEQMGLKIGSVFLPYGSEPATMVGPGQIITNTSASVTWTLNGYLKPQ